MKNRALRQAEKTEELAKQDLVDADLLAESQDINIRREARRQRRNAKRRRSKAVRRQGRAICDSFDQDLGRNSTKDSNPS